MSLNWKEIDKILEELPLAGSRIQEIRQPDYKSLVLELFHPSGPWKFYVNLFAQHCRIHRLTKKPSSSSVPQRFLELLRSRIRGGKIIEAGQPGHDRIVRIVVQRGEDRLILWIRVWGPASNIILTYEDGSVLDAFYRRPKRDEVSGGTYLPLSTQERVPDDSYEIRPYPQELSFNAFIESYYRSLEEETAQHRLKEELLKQLEIQETKLYTRLKTLTERKEDYRNFDLYKTQGDLILSHLHELHKGDTLLTVPDSATETVTAIPLSPTLSPYENAEGYYKKYKKAKSGLHILEEEISLINTKINHIRLVREQARQTEDTEVLKSLLGKPSTAKKQKKEISSPGLSFTSQGFTILVGRTALENDELLRHYVKGNDLWLHTRDYPGAYVFIKGKPAKSIPLDTLLDAGNLAVFYSKARESGTADVYYTQVKYLRRAKGEKVGTVLPTQEKNLTIRLDEQRLRRIQEEAES
ncbi:MAG TPA: NFACT family protein [Spirochaetales bacterium]|nr:NFACT family protein [Spirochaetales bacterium]HOV39576.1 NFACT family protein [Spirochaetales bacterium]